MKVETNYTLEFISRFICYKQNFKYDQIKKINFYTLEDNSKKKEWRQNDKISDVVNFDAKITKNNNKLNEEKKEIVLKYDTEIKKIKNVIDNLKITADTEKKNYTLKENELNKSIDELKVKLGIPVEKKEKKPKLKSKKPQKIYTRFSRK